ncbi:hypothetical protein, conserved [Eimeria brunetti]|uniref:Uncharacterized protein n=1 Tax=Eimeria brunetti TaxID=51314 RepID=U6LVK1_9EIME|nr:hypothetical protein, conserved [Eimeria brunetti]
MSRRSQIWRLWGNSHFHIYLFLFLVFTGNSALGRSNLTSDHPITITQKGQELSPQRFGGVSLVSISSSEDDLLNETRATGQPVDSSSSYDAVGVDSPQLPKRNANFDVNRRHIAALLDGIRDEEHLKEQRCLKSIVHPSAAIFLNPSELSVVKSSVNLHFGAIWMWNKVAQTLLQNPDVPDISKRFWSGVPPPVEVGDVVKVMEAGSTIVQSGEYTIVGIQGDECIVEKEGERVKVSRDRVLLTVKEKYRNIADKVLRNELKSLGEEDPDLLADMEETFELAGVGDAFRKASDTGDPRYLQTAMKTSEVFHSYEILQLIRAYTALEGCTPLTDRNLYGTGSELVARVVENAKFEAVDMEGEDTLQSVLENQCRSAVAFVFPGTLNPFSLVIPHCVDVWQKMRSDWSQLGQVAPGYLSECDARCMEGVMKRNYWFDSKHIKRKPIARESLLAGDGIYTALGEWLLSCHASGDTEALCKVFGPFASLAIRIALFLRVEVEEHGNKGWTEAVSVFSGRAFDQKLYKKAVQQMTANASKFIEKFMGGFGHKAAGKFEKVRKRIRNIFGRKSRGKSSENTVHQKVGHDFAKLLLTMWTNGSQHQRKFAPSKVEQAFYRARKYQTLMILNRGVDPIRTITKDIKVGCKNTSTVQHKYWSLLDKGKTKIPKIADELGLGMVYGFATGKTYSTLSQSGRALAAACKGKSQLDLLAQGTSCREIMELHQCMKLRGLGVEFLRIALKSVKTPTADVTGILFSFIKQIRAIRKEGAKGLYKAYLQWEEQNHMLAEAGKLSESDTNAEDPVSPALQSCHANPNDVLDLQQAQAAILPENVIFSTLL